MAPGFVKLSFNLSAFAGFILAESAAPDEIQRYQACNQHKASDGAQLASRAISQSARSHAQTSVSETMQEVLTMKALLYRPINTSATKINILVRLRIIGSLPGLRVAARALLY